MGKKFDISLKNWYKQFPKSKYEVGQDLFFGLLAARDASRCTLPFVKRFSRVFVYNHVTTDKSNND